MRRRTQVNTLAPRKPFTRHIRIDANLHKALRILAAKREVTMVRLINDLLRPYCEEKQPEMAQNDK